VPSEFPIFEPCFTLQENLDRLADIDDPSHLKPISMTRIEAWLALLGVSFVNAVVIWALSFVADLSVMWIVIWSLTGFVMSWVCGVVGWVLHALVYRFWCCYY